MYTSDVDSIFQQRAFQTTTCIHIPRARRRDLAAGDGDALQPGQHGAAGGFGAVLRLRGAQGPPSGAPGAWRMALSDLAMSGRQVSPVSEFRTRDVSHFLGLDHFSQ